jgi:hypothetical protein
VVAGEAGGGAEVGGFRLATGDRLWTARFPSPAPAWPGGSTVQLFDAGPVVAVTSSNVSGLVDHDGAVVRQDLVTYAGDLHPLPRTDGRLALQRGYDETATITIVDLTGDPHDVTIHGGAPVRVSVDDGSLPDLVLTSDTDLHAWDASTGKQRWDAAALGQVGWAVVLDGSVYVPTGAGVVAVDGTSGAVRWTVPPSTDWQDVRTDGRHLIVIGSGSSGVESVSAYALDDGHEVWRTTELGGQTAVDVIGHRLYGVGGDGTLVALG